MKNHLTQIGMRIAVIGYDSTGGTLAQFTKNSGMILQSIEIEPAEKKGFVVKKPQKKELPIFPVLEYSPILSDYKTPKRIGNNKKHKKRRK